MSSIELWFFLVLAASVAGWIAAYRALLGARPESYSRAQRRLRNALAATIALSGYPALLTAAAIEGGRWRFDVPVRGVVHAVSPLFVMSIWLVGIVVICISLLTVGLRRFLLSIGSIISVLSGVLGIVEFLLAHVFR